MPRGKELLPQLRSRICELRRLGCGPAQIKRAHPEIPLTTIKTTIYREAQRDNNNSRPRSGRPRAITEEQRDFIYDTVTHTNPNITNRELLDEIDNVCKKRALQSILRELGRRKWLQRKRPLLTPRHADLRLQWARRYEHINWKRVKWSDECMVVRGQGARPKWTFLRPREQLEARDVKQVKRQGGVKQMFWAAFGDSNPLLDRTGLMALDGSVNGQHIIDLYSAVLPDFLAPDDIFMHDNATAHTAYIVRHLMQQLGVTVMIWPPYSPDLNPIENLWALMKAEIYRLHPELETAPDTEETLAQLVAAAKEAWHAIDEAVLKNLVDTMPHRVAAVIEAEGWYTKY